MFTIVNYTFLFIKDIMEKLIIKSIKNYILTLDIKLGACTL